MLHRTDNPTPVRRERFTFPQRLASWRDSREPVGAGWFDGSVHSVDARLGECNRLLGVAKSAVADLSIGESGEHLAVVHELENDREHLAGLREDLLTGGGMREGPRSAPRRTAAVHADLSGSEQRWVELEAAKFFAQQDDRPAPGELAERARRHADVVTSTLPAEQSRTLTGAFVEKVVKLGRTAPRPRVAAAPPPPPANLPGELLFLE